MQLQRPTIPKLQRRRDGEQGDSIDEMRVFLEQNSRWITKHSSIGHFLEDMAHVCIPKPMGSQSFIDFSHSRGNSIIVPILEAASLFASGKLVISQPMINELQATQISGHRLYSFLMESISFRNISRRSLFSRYGCVKLKQPTKAAEDVQQNSDSPANSYLSAVRAAAAFGPKNSPHFRSVMFPQSNLVQSAKGHGLPSEFAICFPSQIPIDEPKVPSIVCVSQRFLIQIGDCPKSNNPQTLV